MILGIKVGPQEQSIRDLDITQAPFCEVWFNLVKKEQYGNLFSELKKRHLMVGLHFWGHLSDGTWTSIATNDAIIRRASMDQFKETIDIAAFNEFQYVNIHPSTTAIIRIDLTNETYDIVGEPIELEVAEELFLEHYGQLHKYASAKGVVLTLETIPSRDVNHWSNRENRIHPFTIHNLPNSTVVKAATMGFTIANDFGHTSCSIISEHRSNVAATLVSLTHILATQTRLLHLGYIIPPYNGTDFHDHLDNPVFETDAAVPNKTEMIELLKLFVKRDDVWALVEPMNDHPKNYLLAQKLIDQAAE